MLRNLSLSLSREPPLHIVSLARRGENGRMLQHGGMRDVREALAEELPGFRNVERGVSRRVT
jgi:hypothetical protein